MSHGIHGACKRNFRLFLVRSIYERPSGINGSNEKYEKTRNIEFTEIQEIHRLNVEKFDIRAWQIVPPTFLRWRLLVDLPRTSLRPCSIDFSQWHCVHENSAACTVEWKIFSQVEKFFWPSRLASLLSSRLFSPERTKKKFNSPIWAIIYIFFSKIQKKFKKKIK